MKKNTRLKIFVVALLLVSSLFSLGYNYKEKRKEEKLEQERLKDAKIADIKSHYNTYVKTNGEAKLYILDNGKYVKDGLIGENIELNIENMTIDSDSEYFKVLGFTKEYYIKYDTVMPITNLSITDARYKNYIPFNENVETTDITRLYKDDKLVYELNESLSLPIIIKDTERIYVEYQNQLLYVLTDEVTKTIEHNNTDKEIANGITTIAYHFIYNPDIESCDQIICHTINQVQSHIDYLKQENYFTPTMKEFEMYIDGKLQLPKKSLMITVDDGWFGGNAKEIFTKNKMNASIFFITSGYEPKYYVTDYIEVHSHGDNLHTQGVCPGGQGGAIKCLDRNVLLEDLRVSREKALGSTIFCYPFYEYNNYSIGILKEAGFTMAFGGENAGGHYKMPVGGDKYRIPRFTLLNNTTVTDLQTILNR